MEHFETDDIVLATVLHLKGFALMNIRKNGKRGFFEFKNVNQKILTEVNLCQVKVEPYEFASALRTLTGAVKRVKSEEKSYEN